MLGPDFAFPVNPSHPPPGPLWQDQLPMPSSSSGKGVASVSWGHHALPPCTDSATAQTSRLNAKLCLLDPLLMCSHTLDFADVGTQLATSLHHFLTQDKDIRLNVSVSLINSCSIFLGKTLTFSYLDCYYYNRHPTTPLCVSNLSGSVHWRMLPD